MFKKISIILISLSMLITLSACSDSSKPSEDPKVDETVNEEVSKPEVEKPSEPSYEYINNNSIKDTTSLSLYSEILVNGDDREFRGFSFKVPNDLKIVKAFELDQEDNYDGSGISLSDFIKYNDDEYYHFELEGNLKGSKEDVIHKLTLTLENKDAQATKESLSSQYPNRHIEEISEVGLNAYVVKPSVDDKEGPAKLDIIFNVGKCSFNNIDYYFIGHVSYEGGQMIYNDQNIEEMTNSLLSLMVTDVFAQVD